MDNPQGEDRASAAAKEDAVKQEETTPHEPATVENSSETNKANALTLASAQDPLDINVAVKQEEPDTKKEQDKDSKEEDDEDNEDDPPPPPPPPKTLEDMEVDNINHKAIKEEEEEPLAPPPSEAKGAVPSAEESKEAEAVAKPSAAEAKPSADTPAAPTTTNEAPTAPSSLVNDPDYIESPTDRDILSGRGKFVNYHPGNVVFRQLVLKHKVAYVSCPKPQKSGYAEQIVAELTEQGARFLKQRTNGGGWYPIDKKAALLKTRQALREGAPELSEQLTGKSRYEQVTGIAPGGAAAQAAAGGLLMAGPLGAAGGGAAAAAVRLPEGMGHGEGPASTANSSSAAPSKSPGLPALSPATGGVPPLQYPPALHTLPHPPAGTGGAAGSAPGASGATTTTPTMPSLAQPFGAMPSLMATTPNMMYPPNAAMPGAMQPPGMPYDPAMAAVMMQNAAAMGMMMPGMAAATAPMMYPPGIMGGMAAPYTQALMAQQPPQQQQQAGMGGGGGGDASKDVSQQPQQQAPQQQQQQDTSNNNNNKPPPASGPAASSGSQDGGTLTV